MVYYIMSVMYQLLINFKKLTIPRLLESDIFKSNKVHDLNWHSNYYPIIFRQTKI